MHLFEGLEKEDLDRPEGEMDVLIGFEYAGFHPVRQQSSGHLLVVKNWFGICIAGSHPTLRESARKVVQNVVVHHMDSVSIRYFYDIEGLGVECSPKCGSCKCGRCARGGKDFTIQEERELKMIEDGLRKKGDRWCASYPWIKNPNNLPDNYAAALGRLKARRRDC